MKNLWLDIGNTRLKYWITENGQVIEQAAELHLRSPADLLLGLIQHFKALKLQKPACLRCRMPKAMSAFRKSSSS